jgi:bacterioferritin
METLDKEKALELLNRIMEYELAGVVRYPHDSLMIFGYNRIPIVAWLRAQATEGLAHAQRAGEMITLLGGHPSLGIGPLLESHHHDIGAILREALQHEKEARDDYYELLELAAGRSVLLEEYAREMIVKEEMDADEVNKMLRKTGDTAPFPG